MVHRTRTTPLRRVCIAAALLLSPASALANAPNHDLRESPRVLDTVRGGNPGAAPTSWSHRGAVAPRLVGGRWRVVSNSILVSPEFAIPASGAAVAVRHRAAAGAPVLDVRRDGGGLRATLEPARRERLSWVWLRPSDGPLLRLAFDPVAALGRSVDIGRLGPVAAPIPGWAVTRGAPRVSRAGGRRVIVARERVEILSRRFATGPGARFIEVEARGSGRVRVRAAGRMRTSSVARGWRRLRVPLPPRARRGRVRVIAIPGAHDIQFRVIGRVVRTTAMRGLRRSGSAVTGRIVPRGGRLPVIMRDARGRVAGRVRTGPRGRFSLSAPAGRLTIVTPGDAERLKGTWAVPR